jgi:hypothetical protein
VIGTDMGKNSFHVVLLDAPGAIVLGRSLKVLSRPRLGLADLYPPPKPIH